jgi:hypothetical protein
MKYFLCYCDISYFSVFSFLNADVKLNAEEEKLVEEEDMKALGSGP